MQAHACTRRLSRFHSSPYRRTGLLRCLLLSACSLYATIAAGASPNVLRVGTWNGIPGNYADIQSAVDAAQPGDWVLVAPGDYHEQGDRVHPLPDRAGGAVLITTPNIHLRGMDRNGVIVDGTLPGASACSSNLADQDWGPTDDDGAHPGRNGVMVLKVDGVSIDNLSACNFLDGGYGGGNQIWFNGGDGSGQIGMGAYSGSYLSATSTYWQPNQPEGQYGIFVSNSKGPGLIEHTYASNMADSSYYIGACPDCNASLLDAHAQNSALGYSGTNSGGHLMIGFSEFDNNKTGISSNSQNNDDAPSPQNGACPNGEPGLFGTGSCTYFIGNYIHDNNNPNVPGVGTAELGPVGTGIVLSGGRHDTVAFNRIEHNGAWGVLLAPFPDNGTPPPVADCAGGVANPGGLLGLLGVTCYFDDYGIEVNGNYMSGNGYFDNYHNVDLADISGNNDPGNCFHGNYGPKLITSAPLSLQLTHGVCGKANSGAAILAPVALQVICDTQVFFPCAGLPGNPGYPQRTTITLMPLPVQPTMPDPCLGVPANPWCGQRALSHPG